MIRRPPRSTQSRSSAASDVYKRQAQVAATIRTVLPDLLYSLLTQAWLRKAPKPVAAEPAFRLLTGAVAARSTSIRTSAAREVCGSWTAPVGDRVAEGAADPCLERTLAARLDPC